MYTANRLQTDQAPSLITDNPLHHIVTRFTNTSEKDPLLTRRMNGR